jgi:RHS repeat-associated protein
LQHIQFGDGRIVYNPAEYGYEYHYYHKDHLGNIRQVFRAESTTTYMATMEPENETQEMQQYFHNLSDSRSIDARYNQTEGGRAVAYLDASRGRDYGPVWSKELAQGDSLHAAVLGMLYDPKEKPKFKDLLTGIGRQNALRSGLEGANLTSTSSLGLQPLWLALQLARQLEKAPLPESYLGYILYDQDSLRYDSGRVEISRQAFTNPEELALDITATQGGFVEVYVYNGSASPVWYDQFSISSSQAVIIQENHYYPFGMQIAGLELDLGSKNRYLYNGKELQEDHNLDWHDYGARMYDAQIGRWHVVDPLAHKMPSWSPYTFVFNNPLNFIDPDGRIPYPITIRSFAPFKTFGGGFHGDNRGYTTSSATARVHQVINFDTDKSSISAKAWSSPTSHRFLPGSLTETPSVEFRDGFKTRTSGDSKTFMFGTHSKGANPMVPGSPNIDVFSDFSITENKKAGTLDISGTLTGDNFPSTEAFVTDPSGNNVFIGIGFYEGSPFSSLDGENKRDISSFNFSISTDKKGNFTGIKMGDQTYSIQDWNKMFETADPHKNADK